MILLTTGSYRGEPSLDPIGDAAHDQTAEGEDCVLTPGSYPTPRYFTACYPSGFICHDGEARIKRGTQDTLYFTDSELCRDVSFTNLTIECSPRSGVMFRMNSGGLFEGFAFVDCLFTGAQGYVKWGILGNSNSGLLVANCTFRDIDGEHAMYLHNGGPGEIRVVGCVGRRLGRTFFQLANRLGENGGVPSSGPLILEENHVEDAGLADGGAAFTISGHQGPMLLRSNRVECTEQGNALVIWPEFAGTDEKPGTPNDVCLLDGNTFLGGSCVRPLVRISALEHLEGVGNKFVAGANRTAVDLMPLDGGMAGGLFPVKSVKSGGDNQVSGKILVAGVQVASSDPDA